MQSKLNVSLKLFALHTADDGEIKPLSSRAQPARVRKDIAFFSSLLVFIVSLRPLKSRYACNLVPGIFNYVNSDIHGAKN